MVAPYDEHGKLDDPLFPKPRSKYLMARAAEPRESLKRAHLPVRDKVGEDTKDMPMPGCIPPPSSPAIKPKSGWPQPPHLSGHLQKALWGTQNERPRSAERIP